MNAGKLNRMVMALCSLFSLLLVIVPTGAAHAAAGAQSSAAIVVNPVDYQRATISLLTTEGIATSSSPTAYIVNSGPSPSSTTLPPWPDALVETSLGSANNTSVATAVASGDTISQLSLAMADGEYGYATNAQTLHDVDFRVTGNGDLTVSAAYELLMQVYADNPGESACAKLFAGIYLWNLTQDTQTKDYVTLSYSTANYSLPNEYFSDVLAGILTTSLGFADGDLGSFRVIVDGSAAANVPEPSTLALLGFGLVGAALLRKRNRH